MGKKKKKCGMGCTCALAELGDHHRGPWIALGGLDDEGVSGDDRDGDRPEGNHPANLGERAGMTKEAHLTQGS